MVEPKAGLVLEGERGTGNERGKAKVSDEVTNWNQRECQRLQSQEQSGAAELYKFWRALWWGSLEPHPGRQSSSVQRKKHHVLAHDGACVEAHGASPPWALFRPLAA